MRISGRTVLLTALALLGAALLAPAAHAANFTVNTLVDGSDSNPGNGVCLNTASGLCTFRAAVEEANALAGNDTITFSITGVHPIGGSPVQASGGSGGNLTITGNGSGPSGTVLNGQGAIPEVLLANPSGSTTLTVNSLRVQGVNSSGSGSGIAANGGTLNLNGVVVTGNTGGIGAGVDSAAGALNITDSTISGNSDTSGSPGGGIASSAVLSLLRSTVSGNTATSGGAAIFTSAAGSSIANSTITGNTTAGAGVIRNDTATLTIRNSTIAGNTAGGFNVTLLANAAVNLGNSIVTGTGASCNGTVTSAGNNISSDGTCSPGATDKPSTDPQLTGLNDNGGPTQTMAIYEPSPAVNAGSASLCAASPVNNVDQRGITRPQLSGCDIGAFEYAPYIAPNPPLRPSNKFSFGKLKLKRDGRGILPVTVPGPGVLLVHDAKMRQKLILPGDLSPKAAATVSVKLRPTSHGRARFRAGQTVKTTLKVTFTPSGGAPNHVLLGVKLFKK